MTNNQVLLSISKDIPKKDFQKLNDLTSRMLHICSIKLDLKMLETRLPAFQSTFNQTSLDPFALNFRFHFKPDINQSQFPRHFRVVQLRKLSFNKFIEIADSIWRQFSSNYHCQTL
jgi:hypothetical protein